MKFNTRYEPPKVEGVSFKEPSLTQQQFKQESDINYIVERSAETGYLTDPFVKPSRLPMYGDYSDIPDFISANNIMTQAQEDFMKLPSKLRKEFDNDPNKFLQFMSSEGNLERAIELGLCEKIEQPSVVLDENSAE